MHMNFPMTLIRTACIQCAVNGYFIYEVIAEQSNKRPPAVTREKLAVFNYHSYYGSKIFWQTFSTGVESQYEYSESNKWLLLSAKTTNSNEMNQFHYLLHLMEEFIFYFRVRDTIKNVVFIKKSPIQMFTPIIFYNPS